MSVIPLTIFFSLLLAGFFMVLFARSQRRRSFASAESDSLLPLADEQPRVAQMDPHPESEVERDLRARSERVEPPPATQNHAHDVHNDVDHPEHAHPAADHIHADHTHASHDHNDAGCGCRSGKRAPCPGCLKRPAPPVSPSL